MTTFSDPRPESGNRLLAALPGEVYERLRPHLEPVSLALGDVIYESGEQMTHLYFPEDCIVSLVYVLANGLTVEMGIVGKDGVVGIALFMGGDTVPNRALIQVAGKIIKAPAAVIQDEFKRGGPFQLLVLRYTQALMTQISQTAVCNRFHSVEQRLCRWLLLTHDRVQKDELRLTQEFIANMLGVRREGVTVAAGHLQADGLIRYVRGHITILDRRRMEAAACECYRVVKNESDRLLD